MLKNSLDLEKLECMATKLRTIGHPLRIAIVDMLEKNKEMTVTDIQKRLNIGQAATSNHLRVLKNQRIVKSVRDGKKKIYSLKFLQLSEIINCIEKCTD
ncbi:MAG: metalloregulator ArsR/SmtB family transcription factor [Bacteroidota bacterium]|nr:metalloregulator ArsR/SmtB family transcription factor [Bacteroidota bacterium]